MGASHRFNQHLREGVHVRAFRGSPTKRNGVAEATPLQGGWRTVFDTTRRGPAGHEAADHTPCEAYRIRVVDVRLAYSSEEAALVSMVAAYHTIKPKAVLLTTSAMLYKMFRLSEPPLSIPR